MDFFSPGFQPETSMPKNGTASWSQLTMSRGSCSLTGATINSSRPVSGSLLMPAG